MIAIGDILHGDVIHHECSNPADGDEGVQGCAVGEVAAGDDECIQIRSYRHTPTDLISRTVIKEEGALEVVQEEGRDQVGGDIEEGTRSEGHLRASIG